MSGPVAPHGRMTPAGQTGLTLIEMLVALVIFSIVMSGALRLVVGESRGYRTGGEEMAIAQNLRFGVDQVSQQLRAAGTNLGAEQPEVIYAGPTSFAFNADYASNIANDISAAYIDPDAPDEEVISLPVARAIAIPGSSPVFAYPAADYTASGIPSAAETITFDFAADTSTTRPDDFALWRQVNDQPPEVVIRDVLPTPGAPFFSYLRLVRPAGGAVGLDSVPATWLPLRHTAALHGSAADTGVSRRVDSLRAVRVSYTVTNGLIGAEERRRPTSVLVPLPNMGLAKLQSCGDGPIHGQPLLAAADTANGVSHVELSWAAAVDETSGERDVMRYVLWRRVAADPDWGAPYVSIPAGNATYVYTDAAVSPGDTYVYAVAAQDCTPSLSARSSSAAVTIP